MAGEGDTEAVSDSVDRVFELVIGEWFDVAGVVIDEVVVVAVGVGDPHGIFVVKAASFIPN